MQENSWETTKWMKGRRVDIGTCTLTVPLTRWTFHEVTRQSENARKRNAGALYDVRNRRENAQKQQSPWNERSARACCLKLCIRDCTITYEPKYYGSECDINIKCRIGCDASLKHKAGDSKRVGSLDYRSRANLHSQCGTFTRCELSQKTIRGGRRPWGSRLRRSGRSRSRNGNSGRWRRRYLRRCGSKRRTSSWESFVGSRCCKLCLEVVVARCVSKSWL